MASYSATTQYDQLMGGAYDDSHVFERGGEIEPAAAGARDAPALAIAVKDPVRKVEASMLPGINGGYVTYRVDTRTALPGFARPEASVRRRFREFVVRRRRGPAARAMRGVAAAVIFLAAAAFTQARTWTCVTSNSAWPRTPSEARYRSAAAAQAGRCCCQPGGAQPCSAAGEGLGRARAPHRAQRLGKALRRVLANL